MSIDATMFEMKSKDTTNLSVGKTMNTADPIPELDSLMEPLPSYAAATSLGDDESDRPRVEEMLSSETTPFAVAELAQYLAPFGAYFKRSEGRQSLERHLSGLLTNISRKNSEQIAHTITGTNSQRLQALLTELQWDAAALNQQRVQQLIREATTRGGTLICGEVEMQKQGASSVGVARQYIESLDRTKNCQLLLSWQYVDSAFSWPINAQLFLPPEWVQDAKRCQRARIPEELRLFRTKAELALSLLDEATQLGVPYRGIASTAAYSSDPMFLAELEKRGIEYLVAVPEDFAIQAARRKGSLGEPAKEAIARLADNAWQAISWPRSSGYGNRSLWTRVMAWRMTPEGMATFGWLVAERSLAGRRSLVRYYFTNANPQASLNTLARLSKRTVRIDEFYQFAKSDLGWNHYEGRLWHGLHRYALLVFLAYSFLLLLRTRQSRQEESDR